MENKPKVLTDRYEVGRLLGQGNFAKVYFGRSVHTNQSVAIKVIDKKKMFELERVSKVGLSNQVEREISIMRIVKHPNVVDIYEVLATKTKIFLVIEYCKGGDLFKKIAKGKLKEDVAWKYFRQLINAVDFFHSRGVYHRDIKPENLLLDDNDNLKVCDFGLSTLADCKRQEGLFHTRCGTRAYLSPQVINGKGYDGAKADIWSCGVVLFVLLTNYYPFYHHNECEISRRINKAHLKYPNGFFPEAKRLLGKMLDPNQETRITISKIKESSWFRKYLPLKHKKVEKQGTEAHFLDAGGSGENPEPPQLNAFDIIAMSPGFNLVGLFGDVNNKEESRFTSQKLAPDIISKLREVTKPLKLKIRKQGARKLKLEGSKEGRKGIVSINAEIFEVVEKFHLVELKKCNGDAMEYQKLVEEDLRPALADIVWVWQGMKEENKKLQSGLQDAEQEEQEPFKLGTIVADAWRRLTI